MARVWPLKKKKKKKKRMRKLGVKGVKIKPGEAGPCEHPRSREKGTGDSKVMLSSLELQGRERLAQQMKGVQTTGSNLPPGRRDPSAAGDSKTEEAKQI